MVVTELLMLATETDEERKRLKKMVATNQLRLALETDDERKVRTIHNNYILHVCTMYVYKYSVDMYLLCMMKAKVRWCTCSLWRMF